MNSSEEQLIHFSSFRHKVYKEQIRKTMFSNKMCEKSTTKISVKAFEINLDKCKTMDSRKIINALLT